MSLPLLPRFCYRHFHKVTSSVELATAVTLSAEHRWQAPCFGVTNTMAASLHFFSPDVCLATELIHELSQWTQEELAQTLLVVPTQRLGTHILAGILAHREAIRTPAIVTLEKLLTEYAPGPTPSLIPDGAVELILHQELAKPGFTQLQAGHERELRLLHNELFEQDLRETAFEQLLRTISEDIYKSEHHLGSLHIRAQEIQSILQRLDAILLEQGLQTRSALLATCAKQLSTAWPPASLQGFQRIVLVAYTSVAKSWRPLLRSLLHDQRASFWLHEAPELYHESSPLKELLEWIRQIVGPSPMRPALTCKTKALAPKAWIAASPLEEARWAMGLAKQWIEAGLSPHRIAILVSKESSYGPALRFLSQTIDDCNIALAQSFASLLPGRFLSLLHSLWQGDQECSHLLGLLQHPATAAWLGLDQGDQVADQLREAILLAGIPHDYDLMVHELAEAAGHRLRSLLDRLACFHPSRQASVHCWQQDLQQLIDEFALFSAEEAADIMQSAAALCQSFVDSLQVIDRVSTAPMTGAFFWDLVTRHLLGGDVRGTGEPLAGLQILSIPEARSMPFARVILLGCQEGYFPQALPQDVLLDNYLKKSMGLPGWEVLESMEDQTFHLLLARLPHMILMRSKHRGDETVVRSRFTEALMVQFHLQEESLPLWAEAFPLPLSNRPSVADEDEGCYPDDPSPLWAQMSASRLEKLIRCPYAFLLNKLEVQDFRPPPWEGDARREGVWLHAVLEAFISGRHQHKQLLPAWDIPSENFAEQALARLMDLTLLLAPRELRESPITRHLEQHAWPQFIAHLLLLGAQQPGLMQSQREIQFGGSAGQPASVQIGSATRLLIGRIDALDQFGQLTLITDYKRRRCPSIAASERGLAPQLAVYALALACLNPHENEAALLLGYWNIYEGKWQSHAINTAGRQHPIGRALSSHNTPQLEDLKQGVVANWQWREEEVRRQGRFYADPSACELCNYDGLCRKEDPRSRVRIQAQNAWEKRIKAHARHKEETTDATE